MKKVLIVLLLVSGMIFGQEQKSNWTNKLTAGLAFGQLSYSNWTKGGENQLSWTLNLNGSSVYETKNIKWENALKVSYGRTKTGDDIEKTMQNDLLFNSLFSVKSSWLLDYYAGLNLITQSAPGYDYSNTSDPVQTNSLFDPADITESFGLVYAKGNNFKSQLGLALHEVIASNYYAKTDDPATAEIEKSVFETGIESITTFRWEVVENVSWDTYLRLFSAFDRLDTWDVRWDNTLVGKVNSWLNVNLTWIVVYDVSESLKTQAKEGLQIGISYNLL
jgi:hypothetical protein